MVHPFAAQFASLGLPAAVLLSACAGTPKRADPPPPEPVVIAPAPAPVTVVETVTVHDPELEQRAANLEVRLLEREAQIEDLQNLLDLARQEVVRVQAKLATGATRAEAASAIAEAEIAVQQLRSSGGQQAASEISQASRLLQQSSLEFNKPNYGGALYLANEAKRIAGVGRGRVSSSGRQGLLPGESLFAVPLRLKALSRCNVRTGPSTSNRVLFTMEGETPVTGYGYVEGWIRVTDESGRSGWVSRSLVGRR